MRKIALLSVILIFGVLIFSSAVFAAIPGIEDYNPDTPVLEIDPKLMFDEEKLVRRVVVEGKEYKDVIGVNYSGGDYYVWSLADEYKEYGKQLYSKWASNFEEYIEFRLTDGIGKGMGENYPYHEIISINGKPWQKTKYKDIIIEAIKNGSENGNSGGLKDNKELWDVLYDSRFNGFAAQLVNGKITKQEALQKALEYGNESVKESDIKKTDNTIEKAEEKLLEVENGAVLKIDSPIIELYQNGVRTYSITLSISPKVAEGYTLVPLRGVFDNFGAKLLYNGETEEVIIEIDNKEIILKIGSKTAVVNGKEIQMDKEAVIENGRTLIPLRFVSEQLGYKVKWIAEEEKIIIEN